MEDNDQSVEAIWGTQDVSSGKGAADENFPVGSFLIARVNRPHVKAYYDFARVIDDIVDNDKLTSAQKITRLNAMDDVVRGTREAPPRRDAQTAVSMRATILKTGVPESTATDLIVAFLRDAVKNRYETWEELADYCRYSANPVGRFLLCLHNESPQTFVLSDALCTSLQVLNHLQDCVDDLKVLDRCYLPKVWMDKEGASIADLEGKSETAALRRVFNSLLDEVDRLNRVALELPSLVKDRRMRMESAVIVSLAHSLAARLRTEDPVAGRVKLRRIDLVKAAGAAIKSI